MSVRVDADDVTLAPSPASAACGSVLATPLATGLAVLVQPVAIAGGVVEIHAHPSMFKRRLITRLSKAERQLVAEKLFIRRVGRSRWVKKRVELTYIR